MISMVPAPPLLLKPLSEDERAAIADAIRSGLPSGQAWAEKLRRFASLAGRSLRAQAKDRFRGEAHVHLAWMADQFLAAALRGGPSVGSPVDQAYLNALLYCLDALGEPLPGRADDALCRLEAWLVQTASVPLEPAAMGPVFAGSVEAWRDEAGAKGLVIICPSPFSLFSLSVLAILTRLRTPVCAIVVRKFTLSRAAQEWRRDGWRLAWKVWRKLILRTNENAEHTAVSLRSVLDRLAQGDSDIRSVARSARIPVIEVAELNDAVESLRRCSAQCAIFTGGGMIRDPVLAALPLGIVNVHMGSLPQHKGMDVVQAPILEGNFADIALTAHLMEQRLDRGPVLTRFKLSSESYSTLGALRNEIAALMPMLAVEAALGRLSGRLRPMEQLDAGRQYYFCHDALVQIIARVMAKRARTTLPNSAAATVERFFADFPHMNEASPAPDRFEARQFTTTDK